MFDNNSRPEHKIDRLERKLDLVLQHLRIEVADLGDFTQIDDLLCRDKKTRPSDASPPAGAGPGRNLYINTGRSGTPGRHHLRIR